MQHGFISVPFKTDKHSGLSEVNGIAKFSPAGVVLEFESKLFGLISDGVKECRIAVGDILDVNFRKGFFKRGAKVEIRMTNFTKLAELPSTDGKLTLKLKKVDFERGKEAVEELQKYIARYNAELPPPQTSVGQLFGDESEDETKRLDETK